MNKARRAQLDAIYSSIEELVSKLETIRDEEQETYDAMPDSFRDGDKGEASQACIEAMESALGDLETVQENIETAKGE
jgi:hypothetical protein